MKLKLNYPLIFQRSNQVQPFFQHEMKAKMMGDALFFITSTFFLLVCILENFTQCKMIELHSTYIHSHIIRYLEHHTY